MRLPHWLRRRVRRFDRRWVADQVERERHESVVASRLVDRQPVKPRPRHHELLGPPESTAVVVRKNQP
jgi:hypothetical protein